MPGSPTPLAAVALAVALLAGACGGGSSTRGAAAAGDGIPVGDVVPDFALLDVNAASPTFRADVSPRDHLGGASAWYFGHAT